MPRLPLLVTGIALAATGVFRPAIGLSQINNLNIFSNVDGTSCLVSDHQPGTLTVYVFHHTSHALAAQFRIANSVGFTGVYYSHQVAPGFLDLGTPPTDYAVSYASCLTGSILVTSINYIAFGTSAACSHLTLEAAPTSPIPGELAVVNCDLDVAVANTFGPAVVNYSGCPAWCIGATESTSWGKIKALYR